MHRILYIISFILVGYSQVGESIYCWECNSNKDPNCGDPFKPSMLALTDCSQRFLKQDIAVESTICRKLTQKVNGQERIYRSCGYLEPEEAGTCINRAGTHLVFSEYCQCAGDGCNKAGHLQQPPSIRILLAALLIALLYHLS